MLIGKDFGMKMKIKVNKKAPNFKLNSTSSKPFELSRLKDGLVIYFYPKDNTPGCTLETKDFSKLYRKFKSLKYEIIGISKDSIKSHIGFKKNIRYLFIYYQTKKLIFKKNMVFGEKNHLWEINLWEL